MVATGGERASGIGGGSASSGSNIIFSANILIKADNNYNPPTTVIPNYGGDLAELLKDKRYVTLDLDPLAEFKAASIARIKAAIKDLSLFPAEVEYINTHIGLILVCVSQLQIDSEEENILKGNSK